MLAFRLRDSCRTLFVVLSCALLAPACSGGSSGPGTGGRGPEGTGSGGARASGGSGGGTSVGTGGTGSGGSSTGQSGGAAAGGSGISSGGAGPGSGGASGGSVADAGIGDAAAGADAKADSAGTGGTGTIADAGSGSVDGDSPATRPLNVTVAKARHQHTFRTKDADPTVTFNENSEIAVIDNRAATLVGKLVLSFGGLGVNAGELGPRGEFAAQRGFHVLGIAAYQDYDVLINDANFYGDARKEVFEGIEYTHTGDFANIHMTPADGVAQRTQKALQYLNKMFPTEDWGYYLNDDGTVRWSDVILIGMSHGASNVARWGMLVRVSRIISVSGPRDNMCTSLSTTNCGGVIAKWLSETPKTPIDRFYAITGTSDDQHLQHLFAMQTMKYTGQATSVEGAKAPYGGSHRLKATNGHHEYCGDSKYDEACNYMLGVPTENQKGTGP